MSEDFRNAIGESVGGDTSNETPAPAAPETTPAETAPAADTASPATGDEGWHFDSAEFDQQHPELVPYRKNLQGSYTKAQQALAEQRKALEGIDEGAIASVIRPLAGRR